MNDTAMSAAVLPENDKRPFGPGLGGKWSWGGVEVDFDRAATDWCVFAVRNQIKHKLDNECASIVSRIRAKANEADESFDEKYEPVKLEIRGKMVERLYKGEISTRIGGARGGTMVETIALQLARRDAIKTLKPKGLWPQRVKGAPDDAPEPVVEFNGEIHTQESLTQAVYEFDREGYDAKAKVEWEQRKEAAKLAKASSVPAKAKTEESLAALFKVA